MFFTLITAETAKSPVPLIAAAFLIIVCIVAGIYFMQKSAKQKTKTGANTHDRLQTAQEFINITDIHDGFLFTVSGEAAAYVRVHGVPVELLSDAERADLAGRLTADFSNIDFPFKFIALSRPVDISPLINAMQEKLYSAGYKQKELLLQEIRHMTNVAINAEIIERQFYISVWGRTEEKEDTMKSARLIEEKLNLNGVAAEVLGDEGIINLINLTHNPSYVHIEDADVSAAIPFIARYMAEKPA